MSIWANESSDRKIFSLLLKFLIISFFINATHFTTIQQHKNDERNQSATSCNIVAANSANSSSSSDMKLCQKEEDLKGASATLINDIHSHDKEVDFVPEWNRISEQDDDYRNVKKVKENSKVKSNRLIKKKKFLNSNESQILDTSLNPIYFDAYPAPQIVGSTVVNYNNNLLNNNNPISSFYSLDSPLENINANQINQQQLVNHYQHQSQQANVDSAQGLTPILLQSFANYESQLPQIQKQQQGKVRFKNLPNELDLRKLNFNTIQHALNNLNNNQPESSATVELSNQQQQQQQFINLPQPQPPSPVFQQNGAYSPLLNDQTFKASLNQHHHNLVNTMQLPNNSSRNFSLPVSGTSTKSRQYKNIHYKPSIVNRPTIATNGKVVVNLSSLLKPGEAILSEKSHNNQAGSDKYNEKLTSSIDSNDLERLLKYLKPLQLNEKEKADSDKVKLEDEEDELNDDDDSELDKEELEELRKQKKLSLILPTSHLFGSLGVVNESKLIDSENDLPDSLENKPHQASKVDHHAHSSSASEDQLSFFKTLADLSTKLRERPPASESERSNDNTSDDDGESSDDEEDHENHSTAASWLPSKRKSLQRSKEVKSKDQTIPIDVIVDHLMSSSRIATFGLQHDGLNSQHQQDGDAGKSAASNEDDDDDDEDDDDADNNGTLPAEAHGNIEAHESKLNEAIVAVPSSLIMMNPQSSISFDSVLNKSNSWIPMDNILLKSKEINQRLNNKEKAESLKKKRKRRKRKKFKNDGLNLVIGNRKLSRTDLIRLIQFLNKMASQKEPSKQREASRKLLRFLIKLALEEYKKTKSFESKSKLETDPLRSVLMGPLDSVDGSNKNDSVIELRSLGLIGSRDNRDMGDEEEGSTKSIHLNFKGGRNKQPSKQQQQGDGGLRDLSEELENYFDSDFFEDMADKLRNTSLKQGGDDINDFNDSNANQLNVNKPKQKSRPRRPYKLPIPIYGHQLVEAADEDDVDLDHIRIPAKNQRLLSKGTMMAKKTRKRRRPTGNNGESNAKKKVTRRRRKRKLKNKITENDSSNGDDEGDNNLSNDNANNNNDKEDERQQVEKSPRIKSNINRLRESSSIDETRLDSGKKNSDDSDDDNHETKLMSDDSNEGEGEGANNNKPTTIEDNQSNEHDEEEENSSENNSKQEQKSKGRRNYVKDGKDSKKKKKKQVYRNKPGKSHYMKSSTKKGKVQNKKVEIDLDSRYEIPAPIEAGKLVSDNTSRANSAQKGSKNNKKSSTNDEYRDDVDDDEINKTSKNKLALDKRKSPFNNEQQGSRDNKKGKRHDRSIDQSNKKSMSKSKGKKKTIDDPEEPISDDADEPNDDADYYNEGTSYSKVCDDENKCQITVKSSSPKLTKAIQTGNKPLVEKQLDKWASQTD